MTYGELSRWPVNMASWCSEGQNSWSSASVVCKTTLRVSDLLGLIEFRRVLNSWLQFITAKEYRLKSATEKGA